MAMRMTRPLGVVVGPMWIPEAEGVKGCEGGVKDDQGNCCDWRTFSNATVAAVRGQEALFKVNEDRVRAMLSDLLDKSSDGSDPALVEKAWDDGVPPAEVQRWHAELTAAAQRFWKLFPPKRWAYEEQVTAHECQSDGWFGGYRQMSPPPASAKDAGWYEQAKDVIRTVPGSEPGRENTYRAPGIGQLSVVKYTTTLPRKPLPGGPELRVSPWLERFLDVFGPKKRTKAPVMKRRPGSGDVQVFRPDGRIVASGSGSDAETASSTARTAALVAGSAVAAGGLYLLFAR